MISNVALGSNLILKIGMPHIPKQINHLEINSIYEYIIFDDLLRPLVKFDSNGEIAADLVLQWEIKNKYKNFIFTLKKNQMFSDGSVISASDVVESLKYLIKSPDIVHGDGNKIKKVSIIDKDTFEIELFESDPFFLTELSSPEYRIVKSKSLDYQVSSGSYTVSKNNKNDELVLKINNKYNFPREPKYKEVHFLQYNLTKNISDKFLAELDIIWPKTPLKQEDIARIKDAGFNIYQLNLGFSFWFALNPNNLKKDERVYIKNKLDHYWKNNNFFKDNIHNRSYQLFLPYGPGRLAEDEVKKINSTLVNETYINRVITVLLSKSVPSEIEKSLLSMGIKIKIDHYDNFTEYSKLIKSKKYDIVYVNNDLSSIDLRSSLLVTFNPSRPLVFVDKDNKEYELLLKTIKSEQNTRLRYQGIKKLGAKVLEDVLVYPLFYSMTDVFAKKNIDLNDWNKAGAETFSWKIK